MFGAIACFSQVIYTLLAGLQIDRQPLTQLSLALWNENTSDFNHPDL